MTTTHRSGAVPPPAASVTGGGVPPGPAVTNEAFNGDVIMPSLIDLNIHNPTSATVNEFTSGGRAMATVNLHCSNMSAQVFTTPAKARRIAEIVNAPDESTEDTIAAEEDAAWDDAFSAKNPAAPRRLEAAE